MCSVSALDISPQGLTKQPEDFSWGSRIMWASDSRPPSCPQLSFTLEDLVGVSRLVEPEAQLGLAQGQCQGLGVSRSRRAGTGVRHCPRVPVSDGLESSGTSLSKLVGSCHISLFQFK